MDSGATGRACPYRFIISAAPQRILLCSNTGCNHGETLQIGNIGSVLDLQGVPEPLQKCIITEWFTSSLTTILDPLNLKIALQGVGCNIYFSF